MDSSSDVAKAKKPSFSTILIVAGLSIWIIPGMLARNEPQQQTAGQEEVWRQAMAVGVSMEQQRLTRCVESGINNYLGGYLPSVNAIHSWLAQCGVHSTDVAERIYDEYKDYAKPHP